MNDWNLEYVRREHMKAYQMMDAYRTAVNRARAAMPEEELKELDSLIAAYNRALSNAVATVSSVKDKNTVITMPKESARQKYLQDKYDALEAKFEAEELAKMDAP